MVSQAGLAEVNHWLAGFRATLRPLPLRTIGVHLSGKWSVHTLCRNNLHPMTSDNVRITGGKRCCRVCYIARMKRHP